MPADISKSRKIISYELEKENVVIIADFECSPFYARLKNENNKKRSFGSRLDDTDDNPEISIETDRLKKVKGDNSLKKVEEEITWLLPIAVSKH